MTKKYTLWFEQVTKDDVDLVGGKGANLGEMVQAGMPVPDGFIVTSHAYFEFVRQAKIKPKLKSLLRDVDINDPRALDRISKAIKKLIIKTRMPKVLADAIIDAYLELGKREVKAKKKGTIVDKLRAKLSCPLVAVRSSATAEDLPAASFAGQQATFLNVFGEAEVVEKVKKCWASLFEARAIFYRSQQKFDHFKLGIAVPVQLMIQSDSSGVLFTVDPVTGDKKTIIIEAIYGLGEYIVQGAVTPDHYKVDKRTLHITEKTIVKQEKKLALKGGKTKNERVLIADQERQKISDREILALAKLGKKIERHYYFPQDVEWAIKDGRIFIVQTRPVTTIKTGEKDQIITLAQLQRRKVILTGDPASPGIARGPVRLVHSARQVHRVRPGEVLVAPQTNPDYVPAMRKAVAIVTEKGGRTSHAAIVSRELGLPAVVGAANAMKVLKEGKVVTVEGTTGNIYLGGVNHAALALQRSIPKQKGKRLKTATKVYVNLAEPSRATEIAKRQVDGIGLLRAEFMIAHIGYHPKKLIKEGKQRRFVTKLSEQLEVFCQAFNPRPVVYRTTDFKTNEYRNLKGGQAFEPEEPNPMLGFRGAARYIADPEVFMLELEAVKRIRNKKRLRNLWLMIPFVRTPEELIEVKRIIASAGLLRSPTFKLWMMVELPINVIMLEDFIAVGIDGVSIGSNDLTMLIMGTDRDNSEVAQVFDERSKAVLWALKRVVTICHKKEISSSICGQAPSDYADIVENLVKWGITSISVNPDAIERARETIYAVEKRLVARR